MGCQPSSVMLTLTHWGRVTHICVSKRTIIGSDNGLSPSRRQAIIWTNAGILLIGPSGKILSENLIEIHTFSFTKMHFKMPSGKWWSCCLGLNVLTLPWRAIEFFMQTRSILNNKSADVLVPWVTWGLDYKEKSIPKIHMREQEFSNMASDWLAAVLPANQKPVWIFL